MKLNMTLEQKKRFRDFLLMDDFEFYERFIADLPPDAQERFFEETPDFFSEYLNEPGEIDLENDKIYQNIRKKIAEIKKHNKQKD